MSKKDIIFPLSGIVLQILLWFLLIHGYVLLRKIANHQTYLILILLVYIASLAIVKKSKTKRLKRFCSVLITFVFLIYLVSIPGLNTYSDKDCDYMLYESNEGLLSYVAGPKIIFLQTGIFENKVIANIGAGGGKLEIKTNNRSREEIIERIDIIEECYSGLTCYLNLWNSDLLERQNVKIDTYSTSEIRNKSLNCI